MKKVILKLVQKKVISPLALLLFFLIFGAIHAVAFITGEFMLLRLFYPMLAIALIAKVCFDR